MDKGGGGGGGGGGGTRPLRHLHTPFQQGKSWRCFYGWDKTPISHVRLPPSSIQPSFLLSRAQMQRINTLYCHEHSTPSSRFELKRQQTYWLREERKLSRGGASHSALISYPPLTTAERTLQLQIDYFQVLGAETHYSADAIVRAYEARTHNPPLEGFSQEALLARQSILKAACDTLTDPDMRGRYNLSFLEDESGALVVEIPWSRVPGALCLLQEVGEMELVLQVGQGLLEEKAPVPFKQDIALAMALAYVELSREAMTQVPPNVVQSCKLLESASRLLQFHDHGQEGGSSLAPALRAKIDETLEEITPRCVLELLALPLDEHYKHQREDGLRGVRTLLWEAGFESSDTLVGGFSHEQFMQEAFSRMAAAEQVALFTETPTDIPADPSELFSVAYAHVAEGFTAKRPELIQAASNFFLKLQGIRASNPGMAEDFPYFEVQDLALGRGMCELLLGKVDSCRICLGLEDEKPAFLPILEFVQANTVEGEGNLLGLCKLLEGWLAEEVLSKFRDTEGFPVKLQHFFDEPQVIQYLEKLERGGSSPLAAAAAIVHLREGAGVALNNVKATLQKVFPLGEKISFEKNSGQNSARAADTSDYDPNYAVSDNSINSFENILGEESRKNDHAYPLNDAEMFPHTKAFDPIKQLRESRTTGKPQTTSLPPDRHGTLEMPSSKKGLSPVQIACAGLLFGGLVMAGLRILPVQGTPEKLKIRTLVAAMEAVTVGISEKNHGRDVRLAEDLVRKWQVAKAQALGSSHSLELMHEILDAQMLKSWSERANNVASNGWYWDYKLIGVNIDSVTISEDGKRAFIEATLREAASLFCNHEPQHKDSYESTYTTRYEACQKDGCWKITDGLVLRS